MPLWIDSHAHLTMYDHEEVEAVLGRAEKRGVRGILVPATGAGDLATALALARDRPHSVVAAAGIHPHEASSLDDGAKRELRRATREHGVVAVGEIGLDYHYMSSPREDQLRALEWQLDLALESRLPVVIHNRESWQDLEPLLAQRSGRLRGVCHSFTEGPAEARRVVELGLRVGISGMVTFKAADNIRTTASALEPRHVLVETDSPYLAPVPHRGRRNEPAYVVEVGRRLAELWGVPAERVAEASTSCFREVFGVPEAWPDGADGA